MARYIKRLLPTLVLMAVIISLGAYMLVTMISAESAAQRAWNNVLELDYERADRAKSAMTLVEELEALEARAAGESEQVRGLRNEIAEAWPGFAETTDTGEVTLPPMNEMKTKLMLFIKRG